METLSENLSGPSRASQPTDRLENTLFSKVLVIYTGGTIGMLSDPDKGLVPVKKKLKETLSQNPLTHDREFAQLYLSQEYNQRYFVLPWIEGKSRILYEIYEYEELLDSSNMSFDNWRQIAMDIYSNYNNYEGFVVLHGTDTMAYTASALSFMLENLGKTVIVTGSQIPIFQVISDGRDNFISSLILAGHYTIPEVAVFFNHKLFRGNRVTKTSADNFNAFDSHNMIPLATVGVAIEVNENIILRPDAIAKFQVNTTLNPNVAILRLFPNISLDVIKTFFSYPIEGVVIQSYGAGNMPTNRNGFFALLSEASARGVIIINCTQCLKGSVHCLYETSKLFVEAGVLSGHDMTAEAALTKMSYVLSKTDWSLQKKKQAMMRSIRGELTQPPDPEREYNSLLQNISQFLNLTHPIEVQGLQSAISHVLLSSSIFHNDLNRLVKLCDSGINIHAVNSDNRSLLHLAVGGSHIDVIKFLLLKGLSVHTKDSYGQTALTEAIRHERQDVVEILVENGANLELNTLGDFLTSERKSLFV
ncbi:L-asparaginase 1-like isoform X2 [Rhodnius prolixus]|uniref:L-asparaginase 1-like isoform X2 n=1 Tax=Rhodnius prolixus TaxID=13249 RepID=UPI003D187CE9